ncbi:MAG: glycosyltransferase family 39 protein [Candidatus Coatesbacteria bacterium]|nr:glycosyltransferase family 39 protein [Candidatus Coatesbacteria bacterium]
MTSIKPITAVILIFSVAVLARVAFVTFFGIPPAVLDASEYVNMARNIRDGNLLNASAPGEPELPIRVPLYGYFIAALYAIFGDSNKAVVAAHILLSASLSLIVFYLGRKYLNDSWAAFLGAMLLALHLPSAVHCGVLYPDTLFAFLIGVSVVIILQLLEKMNIGWALAAGAILGIATMCKSAAQMVVILVVGLLMFTRVTFRRKLALSAVAVAAFLAVIAPWIIRNYIRFDAFIPTGTLFGFNFLTGADEELVPPEGIAKPALSPEVFEKAEKMGWIERNRYFFEEGKRVFIKNLSDLPRRALLKTGIIFIDYPRLSLLDNIAYNVVIGPRRARAIVWTGVLQNLLYVIMAIAALVFCRRTGGGIVPLTLLFILYFWSGYVLTRSLSRYSIPLYPFICLFAGCTLSRMLRRFRSVIEGS